MRIKNTVLKHKSKEVKTDSENFRRADKDDRMKMKNAKIKRTLSICLAALIVLITGLTACGTANELKEEKNEKQR